MNDQEALERSLELAAERLDDLTPIVYERLFQLCPEAEKLFELDLQNSVKGSMLTQYILSVFDIAAGRSYIEPWLRLQYQTHIGYGVSETMYLSFNDAIEDALAQVLGSDWTAQADAAWKRNLANALKIMKNEAPPR